ncbi:pyridoxal phosphate-dependent transferase [Chytriomyces sp. MP71]|nr:pyridoxal phosphate-dependent transferase [Chytriomyces sp. MP71]
MNASLAETDPEVFDIIKKEKQRQRESINFPSAAVMSALGSVMKNKYSEGYPNARYHGENQFIDQAELLCQKRPRALQPRSCKMGVNVQALSGAPANLYVYNALMKPHERLMGLDLPHATSGFQRDTKKISAISSHFESMPYRVREDTGLIDFEMLQKTAALYRPKMLIAGSSAYARNWGTDIAHLSGLIGAEVVPHPFDHTTGPRPSLTAVKTKGAMIFLVRVSGIPGGLHNHTITALTIALKQAKTPEFQAYQMQVLKNAKAMENAFRAIGFELVYTPTSCGFKKDAKIDGARNTMPDDKSALIPYGLRVGSPAIKTCRLVEKDFETVVGFVVKATEIAIALNELTSRRVLHVGEGYRGGETRDAPFFGVQTHNFTNCLQLLFSYHFRLELVVLNHGQVIKPSQCDH